jgi:hypothetical protein
VKAILVLAFTCNNLHSKMNSFLFKQPLDMQIIKCECAINRVKCVDISDRYFIL